MKRFVLIFVALLMLVLAACQSDPSSEQIANEDEATTITVYHSPT